MLVHVKLFKNFSMGKRRRSEQLEYEEDVATTSSAGHNTAKRYRSEIMDEESYNYAETNGYSDLDQTSGHLQNGIESDHVVWLVRKPINVCFFSIKANNQINKFSCQMKSYTNCDSRRRRSTIPREYRQQ